jgi:hypothetical protein
MNIDDILTLAKAGYTAEEIKALNGKPEAVPEAEPEKAPEVKPEAVPEAEPEKAPEVKPEAVPEIKTLFDNMLNELKGMREDLQKRSIYSDESQIIDPEEAGSRILAQIIDPPVFDKKTEKKGKRK